MEMYLKTIYEIVGQGDSPRIKTIATQLGVTMPSVSGAIDSLQKKGLVAHDPYGDVKLTTKGRRVAREVKNKNDLIYQFLHVVLKLPEATAEKDACALEHVVSPKTIDRISQFLLFSRVCELGADKMIEHFGEWIACSERGETCASCLKEGDVCS